MLDLQQVVNEKLYEIRLLDGRELKLKRPTQRIYEYVAELNKYFKSNREIEALSGFMKCFTMILNRNVQKVVFTEEELQDDYDISIVVYVIKDYFEFWNKDIAEQVDFQPSQQEK